MAFSRRTLFCHTAAISIGLCVALLAVLLTDRRDVLTLDAGASFILPNPAKSGDVIAIVWRATALRSCAGTVIPRIIDGTGRIYEFSRIPTVYQDIMKPDARTFTKTLTLPSLMAPGPAEYKAVVVRWCNIAQEYLWPMVDRPFPIKFEIVN